LIDGLPQTPDYIVDQCVIGSLPEGKRPPPSPEKLARSKTIFVSGSLSIFASLSRINNINSIVRSSALLTLAASMIDDGVGHEEDAQCRIVKASGKRDARSAKALLETCMALLGSSVKFVDRSESSILKDDGLSSQPSRYKLSKRKEKRENESHQ